MATCCAPSGSSRRRSARRMRSTSRPRCIAARLCASASDRRAGRLLSSAPSWATRCCWRCCQASPRVATAQQRQRLVAHRGPQPGELARRIARQDQAERQQREDRRQHPGRRVVQERRQAVAHGIAGRRQRIEGHQVGQPRQRRGRRTGGMDARQPERGQYQDQQGKSVDQRQHAEGARRPPAPPTRCHGQARAPATGSGAVASSAQ